jgi:hypothetical protein
MILGPQGLVQQIGRHPRWPPASADGVVRSSSSEQHPRRPEQLVLAEVVLESPPPPASALEVHLPTDQVGRGERGADVRVEEDRRHEKKLLLGV